MAAAKNNRANGGSSAGARQERRKMRRGILLLVLFVLFMGGFGFLLYELKHLFFDRNLRFTFQNFELENNGYWGRTPETQKELLRFLRLSPGSQNLFNIDPADVRGMLKSIPNIADAEVQRILPDTLAVRLEERVPRAFLGRPDSELVIDASCMVMNTHQCFGVHQKLPVIVGLHGEIRTGMQLTSARYAIELLMQISRNFPEYRIGFVSVSHTGQLVFSLYRGVRCYYVTMPEKEIPEKLDVLRSAIEAAVAARDLRRKVNLMFDGSVVFSD